MFWYVETLFGLFIKESESDLRSFPISQQFPKLAVERFCKRLQDYGYDCQLLEGSPNGAFVIVFTSSFPKPYPPKLAKRMERLIFDPDFSDNMVDYRASYGCKPSPYMVRGCATCDGIFRLSACYTNPRRFDPERHIVKIATGRCATDASFCAELQKWYLGAGYGSVFDETMFEVLRPDALGLPVPFDEAADRWWNFCDTCLTRFAASGAIQPILECRQWAGPEDKKSDSEILLKWVEQTDNDAYAAFLASR